MNKKETTGLFVFRRDLRLNDNIGLYKASRMCDKLYTCFIFTPEQVTSANKYKSNNAVLFMIDSLVELQEDIQKLGGELIVLFGKQEEIIDNLIDTLDIRGVFFNTDYTPYAVDRDNKIKTLCKTKNIVCESHNDYYLHEPGTILSEGSGEAYKKYTPFYNRALLLPIMPIQKMKLNNLVHVKKRDIKNTISLDNAYKRFTSDNPEILVRGGRKKGVIKLKSALNTQNRYKDTRDFFSKSTSHMSAYIKFGCISIREVYHGFANKYGKGNQLISELFWREFFAHVLYAYPEVVGKSYQQKYRNLKWKNDKKQIDVWKSGNTGFPLVDAAMREMNATGYMHNRGRMLTASFLIKTLLVDWRIGEKYFAENLTDYDIASNNGNWQGISGTGVDMKPYFRDMNPWIQSSKFDPNAEYIKKWVPELKHVLAKDIHKWNEKYNDDEYKTVKYKKPIVDYYKQKEAMLSMYKNA
jgi:deoxyribodipyrimidine photo-lyase